MGQIIRTDHRVGCLYELTSPHLLLFSVPHFQIIALVSFSIWHAHLGHVSFSCLHPLISRGLLSTIKDDKIDRILFHLARHHALPFNKSISISFASFDLIHFDIWDHLQLLPWVDRDIMSFSLMIIHLYLALSYASFV